MNVPLASILMAIQMIQGPSIWQPYLVQWPFMATKIAVDSQRRPSIA